MSDTERPKDEVKAALDAHRDERWGFVDDEGKFVEVPKTPLIQAGMENPPFTVTLWDGRQRQIVIRPAEPMATTHGA